jgi:hypothetical protein
MQKELRSPKLFEKWVYEGRDKQDILKMLESCRKTMLASTNERLERMVFQDGALVWTTYLDPRFKDGFIIDDELDGYEKDVALARLRDEAILLAELDYQRRGAAASASLLTASQQQSPPRPLKKSRPSLFDSPPVPQSEDSDDDMELFSRTKLKQVVLKEMEYYGKPVTGKRGDIDPLDWWRTNRNEYPNLARVAKKWLGVCATSTASERVFSSCGLALNAKRTKLQGTTLEAQVKLKYNLVNCGMSIDDIAQAL